MRPCLAHKPSSRALHAATCPVDRVAVRYYTRPRSPAPNLLCMLHANLYNYNNNNYRMSTPMQLIINTVVTMIIPSQIHSTHNTENTPCQHCAPIPITHKKQTVASPTVTHLTQHTHATNIDTYIHKGRGREGAWVVQLLACNDGTAFPVG